MDRDRDQKPLTYEVPALDLEDAPEHQKRSYPCRLKEICGQMAHFFTNPCRTPISTLPTNALQRYNTHLPLVTIPSGPNAARARQAEVLLMHRLCTRHTLK